MARPAFEHDSPLLVVKLRGDLSKPDLIDERPLKEVVEAVAATQSSRLCFPEDWRRIRRLHLWIKHWECWRERNANVETI